MYLGGSPLGHLRPVIIIHHLAHGLALLNWRSSLFDTSAMLLSVACSMTWIVYMYPWAPTRRTRTATLLEACLSRLEVGMPIIVCPWETKSLWTVTRASGLKSIHFYGRNPVIFDEVKGVEIHSSRFVCKTMHWREFIRDSLGATKRSGFLLRVTGFVALLSYVCPCRWRTIMHVWNVGSVVRCDVNLQRRSIRGRLMKRCVVR